MAALDVQGLASLVGGALPIPFGETIGKVGGGLLSNLLSGGTKTAPGAFAGHHSMYLENLDDSKVNQPDAATYLREAAKNNISVEEVAVLMAADADKNGITAQQVWDGYAAGTSPLSVYFSVFNAQGMGRISAGALGPVGAAAGTRLRAVANYGGKAQFVTLAVTNVSALPSAIVQDAPLPTSAVVATASHIVQDAPLPTSASSLTSDSTLGKILTAAGKGAYDGAVNEAMKTDAGKQAQLAGAKQFANDNALYIALVGIVAAVPITVLVMKAKKR